MEMIVPLVLTAFGTAASILLGVWRILAAYETRNEAAHAELRASNEAAHAELRARNEAAHAELRASIDRTRAELRGDINALNQRLDTLIARGAPGPAKE